MSNLFGNYFGGGVSGTETSRFVGQVVELGDNHKLKIKKVIAEGVCTVSETLVSSQDSAVVIVLFTGI